MRRSVGAGREHVPDGDSEQPAIVAWPSVDGQPIPDGSVGESSLVEPVQGTSGFGSHREPGPEELPFVEGHRGVEAARRQEFRRVDAAATTRCGRGSNVELGGIGILASHFAGIFDGPTKFCASARFGIDTQTTPTSPATISTSGIRLTHPPDTNPAGALIEKQRSA